MKALCVATLGLLLTGTAFAQSHSDKEFMEKASQGNVTEVELSKLALQKSQNADVRAFAQKMIHDHQMLGKKMAPLMAEAGVKPSYSLNTEHQDIYNRLKGLSGTEFDKQYADVMDKDHHEDLKDFQDEVSSTQVPAIKQTVSAGEKVIAQHKRMADELAQKLGVPVAS